MWIYLIFYFYWAVVGWVDGIVTRDNTTSMTCSYRRLLAFEGRMARCRYELLTQRFPTLSVQTTKKEAWNNTFAQQIGHSHPSLYRLLDNLSKDTALVHIALEAEARGQPLRKCLQNLSVPRRDGSKSVAEALRGLRHTIRFVWVLKSTDVTWHRKNIRLGHLTLNMPPAAAALSIMQLMPDTLELHLSALFCFACYVYS